MRVYGHGLTVNFLIPSAFNCSNFFSPLFDNCKSMDLLTYLKLKGLFLAHTVRRFLDADIIILSDIVPIGALVVASKNDAHKSSYG